jgi:hypothetical protein
MVVDELRKAAMNRPAQSHGERLLMRERSRHLVQRWRRAVPRRRRAHGLSQPGRLRQAPATTSSRTTETLKCHHITRARRRRTAFQPRATLTVALAASLGCASANAAQTNANKAPVAEAASQAAQTPHRLTRRDVYDQLVKAEKGSLARLNATVYFGG